MAALAAKHTPYDREQRAVNVSLEPVQTAFLALERAAARDPRWKVLNLALGDADRSGMIHVAQASVFSSILKARPELRARHSSAAALREQEITIRRLDSLFPEVRGSGQPSSSRWTRKGTSARFSVARPIPCTGCGACRWKYRCVPPTTGRRLEELVHELDTRGFVIALIEPVSHDHAASSLLQVDCIFVKRDAGSGNAASSAA